MPPKPKQLTKEELLKQQQEEAAEKKRVEELKVKIETTFEVADELLFKQRNYEAALKKYEEILKLDRSNIDANNSKAYCIKFNEAAKGNQVSPALFDELKKIYVRSLELDPFDVEANFNLGLLYL